MFSAESSLVGLIAAISLVPAIDCQRNPNWRSKFQNLGSDLSQTSQYEDAGSQTASQDYEMDGNYRDSELGFRNRSMANYANNHYLPRPAYSMPKVADSEIRYRSFSTGAQNNAGQSSFANVPKEDEVQGTSERSSIFAPQFPTIKRNLAACSSRTRPCNLIPGYAQTCQTYCAVKSVPEDSVLSPVINTIGYVLDKTLHGICNPVGTVFEIGWKYFVESSVPVFSFAEWLSLMGIDMKGIAYDQIEKAAGILMTTVVKHAQTPLKILREAYEAVDAALLATQDVSQVFEYFNPGCFGINVTESVNQFVNIFYRDPNLLDILLSGSMFVLNAGKHIPGSHQEMFKSVAMVTELILGSGCGVLYWAGVRGAICDQQAGFERIARFPIVEPPCKPREVEVFVTINE